MPVLCRLLEPASAASAGSFILRFLFLTTLLASEVPSSASEHVGSRPPRPGTKQRRKPQPPSTTPPGAQAPLPELALLETCSREGGLCRLQERLALHEGGIQAASEEAGVTVVLNHWRRPAANLEGQLRAAAAAERVKEIWVCIFGSPFEEEYQSVLARLMLEDESVAAKARSVRSDVDFGVYARFLLAASARTRYVYIVDDDVAFPVSIIDQYVGHMLKRRAVWGHAGHVRDTDPEAARWVVRPRQPIEVDYANAAWFLETRLLSGAFFREPPQSWLTGEDMHLSYMVRKVFGLPTLVVGWRRDRHPSSRYRIEKSEVTTMTASIFSFRSFIARAQLARGPVMRHTPGIDSLVYVDTAAQAEAVVAGLQLCRQLAAADGNHDRRLCQGRFQGALVFSGLQSQSELRKLDDLGREVCLRLSHVPCAYVPYEMCGEACQEMQFASVTSFNLQVGFAISGGHNGGHDAGPGSPNAPGGLLAGSRAHLAADALETMASLLGTLHLSYLFVPAEASLVQRSVLHAAAVHGEDLEAAGKTRLAPKVVTLAPLAVLEEKE